MVQLRQKIYDEWLANTIESVDCRSGRQEVSIRKLIYIQKCDELINTPPLEEKINKRGTKLFVATRRVTTTTVRHQLLLEKHSINVSAGTILNLKPFFVTYATEREKNIVHV